MSRGFIDCRSAKYGRGGRRRISDGSFSVSPNSWEVPIVGGVTDNASRGK